MQRRVYTSLASALALLFIGASCAAPTTEAGDSSQDKPSTESLGTSKFALTSAKSTTLWRDFNGCVVCPGLNGGGSSEITNTTKTKTFTESLPAGARITKVDVTIYGTACGTMNTTAKIDNVSIGAVSGSTSCNCGDCNTYTLSLSNAAGIPITIGATHTLSFTVGGGVYYYPSTVDVVFTYDFGATSTTLSTTTNPSVFGQSLTFTAHITPTGPAGSIAGHDVTFVEGATMLGTGTTNAAGDTTFTTSALSVGAHSLQANFAGGDSYGSSSSSTLVQTVNQATTSTALASSNNPSVVGGNTTLTATVTATPPGAGTPSGSVTFLDGATTLGSSPLIAGVATFDVSSLPVGDHALTAVYGGDTSFITSTSNAVSQKVSQDGTTTGMVSDLNPSTYGAPVTFTAGVSSNGTGGTPTGNVTFSEGGSDLGTVALDGAGNAAFPTAALAGGSHTITATYGGDGNHESGSTANVVQLVKGAATTTALETSGTPARHGESVTLTATVSSAIAGTIDGTVTFLEGATVLGTSTITGGKATLTTSALGTASHDVVAVYDGVPNYATSASATLSQVVNASDTTTALIASSNPAAVGTDVTFTATVAPVAPGAGTPTGTVTFKEGSAVLGTGALSNGEATFTTSALTVGTHTITAEYGATTDFNASTSSAVSEAIASLAATAGLTSAPNPSKVKSAVTLTATVAADGGAPSGEITFVDTLAGADAGTTLGTAGLDAGVATLSVDTLTVGNHTLSASYGGDPTYGSTTAQTAHVVTKVPTTTTVAASPNPSELGQAVTLTATVASDLAGATGNVDFFDGTTKLGTSALAGANATLTVTAFDIGGHVISAKYAGDALHVDSTSAAFTQNVGQDAGANAQTDGGAPKPTIDAGTDAGSTPSFDAAVSVQGGCGCSTVPVSSSLAVIPSVALFAGLALRRRARKEKDARN